VRQLVIKVLNIIDARCNHEVSTTLFSEWVRSLVQSTIKDQEFEGMGII